MEKPKILFITGLHRSGTSVLNKTIGSSDEISGFENTGAPKDEGQHLQTVYKPANKYGGVGKFAFNKNARLDENSKLITEENREKLLQEWGRYWDFSKPVLLEKSPPNIIRTRFLQAMFPNSYFVTITRHPISVSYATSKWANSSIGNLIKHWIEAHKIYREDRAHLQREMMFSYEEIVSNPAEIFKNIESFIGVQLKYDNQLSNKNSKYFERWEQWEDSTSKWQLIPALTKEKIIKKYEDEVNEFGYSLIDLDRFPKTLTDKVEE